MKRTNQSLFAALLAGAVICAPAAGSSIQTGGRNSVIGEPPVTAPFLKGEDSVRVNDWWHRPTNEIINLKVPRDQVVAFGIYTVANRTLKASAQLYPLYPDESREVRLEIRTGDYLDGFNNKITMHAYANPNPTFCPDADSKTKSAGKPGWADGWGLIRFKKSTREVTFECWPRHEDVTRPGARQFPGWPRTIKPAEGT